MVNLATTAALVVLAAAQVLAINWHDDYAGKDVECRTFVADPATCVWLPGKQVKLDTPGVHDCKVKQCDMDQKYKGEVTLEFMSSRKPSDGFRYFIGNTSIGYHGPVVAVIEPGQTTDIAKEGVSA